MNLVYPASLPCPSTAPLQWAERRQLSTVPGPRASRILSTDRSGGQSIEIFLRTREHVQVWLDWLRDDLVDGAAWFAASWPQPQGGVGVRRFIGAPSYPQFLPKRGGWLVTAQCQIRGRGTLPTAPEPPPPEIVYEYRSAFTVPWYPTPYQAAFAGLFGGFTDVVLAPDLDTGWLPYGGGVDERIHSYRFIEQAPGEYPYYLHRRPVV